MKPDVSSTSHYQSHSISLDAALEGKLKLPDQKRAGEVSSDPVQLDEYCQRIFGKDWLMIKYEAETDLAKRLSEISARLPAIEELLQLGQPVATLGAVYADVIQSLARLYEDGSLTALLMVGQVEFSIGRHFHPETSRKQAIEALNCAIAQGSVTAYSILGDQFLSEGSVEEAIKTYQLGADKECSLCLFQLACFLEQGVGTLAKDEKKAFSFYRKASYLNYPPADLAMVKLWMNSPENLSLPSDPIVIVKDAMDKGCNGAAMVLAQIYERTQGLVAQSHKLISLYRCAAVEGDSFAQLKLANLLAGNELSQLPILQDTDESIHWYQLMLKSDKMPTLLVARVCMELGLLLMYQNKYSEAAYYFDRAVEHHPEVKLLLGICEAKAWP